MKDPILGAATHIATTFGLIAVTFAIVGLIGYEVARRRGRTRLQRQLIFLAATIVAIAITGVIVLTRRTVS